MMVFFKRLALSAIPLALLCGCERAGGHRVMTSGVELCRIDSATVADSAMEAEIAVYRDSIASIMAEPLCECDEPMVAYRPESGLMRFLADLLRGEAALFAHGHGLPVPEMGLMNTGGIRDALPQGTLTVGDVFRVSPFENSPVVVALDSAGVMAMLNHVAERGGEALSGVSLTIADGRATNVLVGGRPLTGGRPYRVATLDYLATGGDGFECLVGNVEYQTGRVFRDIFINHLRRIGQNGGHVKAPTDVRISVKGKE